MFLHCGNGCDHFPPQPLIDRKVLPTDRRISCIRVLAEIDQAIAEAEDLAAQPVLSYDEQQYLAVHLYLRRQWRERVEVILTNLEPGE